MQTALESILETIGNTPVLPLAPLTSLGSAEVYGKYEAGNPSFSIKDRIALAMIQSAERENKINKSTLMIDATAGNTGIALALVCAVKGYSLVLFMPEDASLERRKMFEGFGATLHLTPKEDGISGAVKGAIDYQKKFPNSFLPNQFDHSANPEAHRQTTAQEILKDFPDGIDALVVGVGTGGTLTGVGSVLKKKFKKLKVMAVEPQGSPVLSGGKPGSHKIQQLGHGFVPKNLDRSLIDRVIQVSDHDAYFMTQRLAREAGILVGISSGASVHAAMQVASELGAGKKVLTFLCDAGQRYFSVEKFFRT